MSAYLRKRRRLPVRRRATDGAVLNESEDSSETSLNLSDAPPVHGP
jgi:hypothetical protein